MKRMDKRVLAGVMVAGKLNGLVSAREMRLNGSAIETTIFPGPHEALPQKSGVAHVRKVTVSV